MAIDAGTQTTNIKKCSQQAMHCLQMQVKEYLNFPHFDYQQVSY
jgi:hypothetical protein